MTSIRSPMAGHTHVGVAGCEVWKKLGGNPPDDPAELHYQGSDTNTPNLNEYTGADAGKPAPYCLRRVNTDGEKGPWSANVSATIPGKTLPMPRFQP